jgi:acyl-CoA hydrolase
VGSFALGTPHLYRFLHDNPGVNLQPGRIVNDLVELGRNHKMTSVNTCVEIDMTGQVCSESIGHRELS